MTRRDPNKQFRTAFQDANTGDQELDVELVWAQKVTLIVPYEPTTDEGALFSPVG